jgi:two-component system response regulator VanR
MAKILIVEDNQGTNKAICEYMKEAGHKGLVLSRNQILDEVWGYDCDVIDRTIDAYIRNIRKKLRLDCITTVKGIGYKFEMGQAI